MNEMVIYKILKREISRIVVSKSTIFFLLILPVLLFVFLSIIYKKGVVREVPVGVLNNSPGELSITYIRMIESTGNMKIISYYSDVSELKKDMLDGKIYAGFMIPCNFEEDVKNGRGSTISILNNTSNLITGNTVLKDATTITKFFSGGVLLKKFRLKSIPENTVLNLINSVKIDSQPLYNPNYNYLTYLIPGLIPAMFQMLIMLTASMIFCSEIKNDTFGELIKLGKNNLFSIFIGKTLPYLLINICTGIGIIGILYPLLNINPGGALLPAFFVLLVFILASFFSGVLISVVIADMQFATEIVLFVNTAAFIFSGFVYPLWAMPLPHQIFAQVMPFTHFMDAFIKTYFMNTPLKNAYPELGRLGVFILIPILLSFLVLYFRSRKVKKECSETT